MNALMTQMAVLLGSLVAAISLAWNLWQRMDLLTAVFRASLVFFATVTILYLFLRFFSNLLVRFVSEQVMQQHGEGDEEGTEEAAASGPETETPKISGRTAPPAGSAKVS